MRSLLVAVFVAGTVGGGLSAAPPDPPPDAAAASIVAALDDASPYPPIERLGRFDGSSYVSVEAGSIDTERVIVVSHGWAPGYEDVYDDLQAQSPTLVPVWDQRLTIPDQGSAIRTIGPLVEALSRAEPDATVLLFSWIDQSATPSNPLDARRGEDATEINGHRLAVALDLALADSWDGELHLIGHSFGSNVVTTAAVALDAPLRQLTLMDSPDDELARIGGAANDLRYKLPRLDIGRTPDSTFVDNYISEVGIRYGDLPGLQLIVDTRLRPPDGSTSGARHEYPLVWYAQALADGAGVPPTGPWWSPLLGGDPASVGGYYAARDASAPLVLTEEAGAPPSGAVADTLWTTVPLELATGGSTLTVGATTDVVEAALQTTDDTLMLEFDVAVDADSSGGATLDVAVDDRLRYTATGPDAGTATSGSMVLLWDVEPGEHTLTVALTSDGDGATATLTDLRLVEANGFVRSLDEQQTTELTDVVLAILGAIVVAVLIGLALLVVAVIRRRPGARGIH